MNASTLKWWSACALFGGVIILSCVALIAMFMAPRSGLRHPPLDAEIDSILRDSSPPRTYSEFIERIKRNYDPIPRPARGQGFGEEEIWREPRLVRDDRPWTEQELKEIGGTLISGGRAPIHWLHGGSPDKIARTYTIYIEGGGGCWGGGGPRGSYTFYVGANDELFGWYTDGISPLK